MMGCRGTTTVNVAHLEVRQGVTETGSQVSWSFSYYEIQRDAMYDTLIIIEQSTVSTPARSVEGLLQ